MSRTTTWIAAGAAAAVLAVAGAGVALAQGGDDREAAITGAALASASAAALDHTRGGTVTDTEVGDEDARYEVEVSLPDGSQVDVHLDEGFEVVGSEADED